MNLRPTKRYVATGNTWPYREDFQSWGWHWDADRRVWIEDNGSEGTEACIVYFKKLPGVIVTIEGSND